MCVGVWGRAAVAHCLLCLYSVESFWSVCQQQRLEPLGGKRKGQQKKVKCSAGIDTRATEYIRESGKPGALAYLSSCWSRCQPRTRLLSTYLQYVGIHLISSSLDVLQLLARNVQLFKYLRYCSQVKTSGSRWCTARVGCWRWCCGEPSPGREDPHQVDRSGGHRIQEVYLSQRRVELRHRHVGGDIIRRATLLGDVQSGCESSHTKTEELLVAVLPIID